MKNNKAKVLVFLAIFSFPAIVLGVGVYDGGDGLAGTPFEIAAAAHLDEMHIHSEDWDKHFILTANIDMSAYTYDTAVIAPDTDNTTGGFQGTLFEGVFDGNDHTINNLRINAAGTDNDFLGLFGKVFHPSAVIKDLGIENCNITGGDSSTSLGSLAGDYYGQIINCYSTGVITTGADSGWVGGLCGVNRATLSDCYSTVSVTVGEGSWPVGGLCGRNSHGTISNSYATGSVTGAHDSDWLGGLCGDNDEGTINYCYATGSVTGDVNSIGIGGLCGANNEGTIKNSYASGPVTGGLNSVCVGGLVGTTYEAEVRKCYSTGAVSGHYEVGGLVGWNYLSPTTDSFWDEETSGMSISNGGIKKSTAQMQTQSTFTDVWWDFVGETHNGTEDMWMIDEGKDYPRLQLIAMPYSLTESYWYGWTGVNLPDYSPGSDSGYANITETLISLHFTDDGGSVVDANLTIFSKWFDQQGWLNIHLSEDGGTEIVTLSAARNLLDYVTRGPDDDNNVERTLFVKKAFGATEADIVGEYAHCGHWLEVSPPGANADFGIIQLNSDHSFSFSADSSDGGSDSETGTWSLDSPNAIINLSTNGGEQLQAGQDGILMQVDIDPVEEDDLGYSLFVKKGNGKTLQNLAGRYTYQEFTTEPDSNEASTSWGIMEIELNGTLTLIRSYYDGTSATDSGTVTIDSDGTFHVTPDGGGFTFDGVLSHDDQTVMLAIMGQSPGGDVGIAIANRSSDCNGNGIADVRDIQGDTNGDGIVNFIDFAKLAEYWLEDNCGMCGCADIVCNGKVDMDDLSTFVENWLADTP